MPTSLCLVAKPQNYISGVGYFLAFTEVDFVTTEVDLTKCNKMIKKY